MDEQDGTGFIDSEYVTMIKGLKQLAFKTS